jgi:hypothetical protein
LVRLKQLLRSVLFINGFILADMDLFEACIAIFIDIIMESALGSALSKTTPGINETQ